MIKGIIFDFDGVIAESIDVKTEAFRKLFEDYPQHIEAITKFHINNGGMSRYDKFRFIYQNILKEHLTTDKFRELCGHFSTLVVEKVISSSLVKGAQEFLDECLGHYKIFVISATPDKEIEEIVRRRNLQRYFIDVLGSPAKKTDLIRKILKEHDLKPEEVVFIGDSFNDFQAAKDTGIFFIARVIDKNFPWLNQIEVVGKIDNLVGLKELLETDSIFK